MKRNTSKQLNSQEQVAQTSDPISSPPETVELGRDEVLAVLEPIYFQERIVSRSLTATAEGKFEISYIFPPYDKISCEGEHISASQISEALIESMYLALSFTIQHGRFPIAVPNNWFQTCAAHLLMFRNSLIYRKELLPDKEYTLVSELVSVGERRLRRRFLALTFKYSGFVSGEIEYLLDFKYVPQLSVLPQ